MGSSVGGGVVKTVILPNEEINRLGVELEELKCFLSAQNALYEEAIKAYEKDRAIRMQEFELRTEDHNDKVYEMKQRTEDKTKVNYELSK